MISDYLKKYSTYYLSRYSVTKKKFEDILKKKITKDFLEKKISKTESEEYKSEIRDTIKYFSDIGCFNEKNLMEARFNYFVKKGYSKKRIKLEMLSFKFEEENIKQFLNEKFSDEKLDQILLKNFIYKSRIIEKQKKLKISERQLFDKIIRKLIQQGFNYEDSIKLLREIISDGNF